MMIVHNEKEAMALIKEAINPEDYNGAIWYTHNGVFLFETEVIGLVNPMIIRKGKTRLANTNAANKFQNVK